MAKFLDYSEKNICGCEYHKDNYSIYVEHNGSIKILVDEKLVEIDSYFTDAFNYLIENKISFPFALLNEVLNIYNNIDFSDFETEEEAWKDAIECNEYFLSIVDKSDDFDREKHIFEVEYNLNYCKNKLTLIDRK
jgi:hypothetical protein